MAQNLEKQLIEKVRALPPHKQRDALRLLDSLAESSSATRSGGVNTKPMWDIVAEVNAELPSDTWDDVPVDGSINVDHYLYGSPKRQS